MTYTITFTDPIDFCLAASALAGQKLQDPDHALATLADCKPCNINGWSAWEIGGRAHYGQMQAAKTDTAP